MSRPPAAFTLIELLVVVAIIVILAGLVFAVAPGMIERANQTKTIANMRGIGGGFQTYANENDFGLPARSQVDTWPKMLFEYLKDRRVYADPSDRKNYLRTGNDPLSPASNSTSYIMNGFNDAHLFEEPDKHIKLPSIEQPSQTILLGMQSGSGNFYMDFKEGNHKRGIFRKAVYHGGANYLFVDGSVRFITKKDYEANEGDHLWLADKSADIP